MGSRKKISIHSHPKNILWLSWRDIKNPTSGGAEKVAIEVTSRFVRDGSTVTIFTSRFKGGKPQEVIRGVNINRRGNRLTCRFFALLYYLRFRRKIDLIIDEINTLPFLTPLFAKTRSVAFIHQLAKEYWFNLTLFPLNYIGYFLEPLYLRLYKNTPIITVSNSTKNDLTRLGLTNIKLVREGLDFTPQLTRTKKNIIVFVSRLNPVKKPEDALKAFKQILHSFPNYQMLIIGNGHKIYLKSLKKLAVKLRIHKKVTFCGYLDQKTKVNYLKKAKIILIPGIREGWGLVATEAQATGCVPISYDIPGLRDSIQNNVNGLLVKSNPDSLSKAAIALLTNDSLRSHLAKNSFMHAQKFSWENTYEDFREVLDDKPLKASR